MSDLERAGWIVCHECDGWPWEAVSRDGSCVEECWLCSGDGGWLPTNAPDVVMPKRKTRPLTDAEGRVGD